MPAGADRAGRREQVAAGDGHVTGAGIARHGLVTGGGGDIGRLVARRMAASGACVTVVDVNGVRAEATVAAIAADGGVAQAVVADVTDEASVRRYVDVATGFGPVTMFFNNAGVHGPVTRLTDTHLADFRSVLEVNVTGVFLGLKHVLPVMSDGGVVVNTGSTASLRGSVGSGTYVAAKHAVLGLTRTAALEMASRGIRVCALCPGPVAGSMMGGIAAGRGPDWEPPMIPTQLGNGRYAEPAEIAGAAMLLFSDDASFVSGTAFVVDGGRTA